MAADNVNVYKCALMPLIVLNLGDATESVKKFSLLKAAGQDLRQAHNKHENWQRN